jgi:hypothetical protein
MTDRKKPGVAFWATVVVVMLVLAYPIGFGPAVWLTVRTNSTKSVVERLYWPVLWAYADGPVWAQDPIRRYGGLGMPKRGHVLFDFTGPDGRGYAVPFWP